VCVRDSHNCGLQAESVEQPLRRIVISAVGVSATEIAVQSDRSLRSTLAIAAMVFQLRVVTGTQ
jgi:hypothetical protein